VISANFSSESLQTVAELLSPNFSESDKSDFFDFRLCQRANGSLYGTDGHCRKGTETDRNIDEDLYKRLKTKGLSDDDAAYAAHAIAKLRAEKAGGLKQSGANLQDPTAAAKYSSFYAKGEDKTFKPPRNTDPAVARAVLQQIKEESPREFPAIRNALGGKGSPTKEQVAAAGWKGDERAVAVLKSLMDNDFKDVHGQDLSWRQGLQLDHREAGSTGGKDEPKNWIWISTATNQAKGGLEAAASKLNATPQEKEAYIRGGLIKKLDENAKMSAEDLEKIRGAGATKDAKKVELQQAMKDNLPLMDPKERENQINSSTGDRLKAMVKGSAGTGKNPETGRNIATRPILSGGNGARVRKDYGSVPQMKALLKLRWGHDLTTDDLKQIGSILKSSTGSAKPPEGKLAELLGNFPPAKPLTPTQKQVVLGAAV